jgi:hypothetical protein
MAEINQIPPSSRYDGNVLNLLPEEIVQNSFGDPRDFIEYYVYDLNDNLLYSNTRYNNYSISENGILLSQTNTVEDLSIDIIKDLNDAGFGIGQYRVVYNFFRKHITTDNDNTNFFIKEISSDRTELRLDAFIPEGRKLVGVPQLIQELNDTVYFEEFLLNFGENKQAVGIRITVDSQPGSPVTILVKLLDPLADEFDVLSECEIVEERSYQSVFEVILDEQDIVPDEVNDINNLPPGYIIDAEGRIIGPNGLEANVNLTGRTNFNRSTNQNRFSKYYNIDDIALNDKFAQFLNFISSSKAEINVDFEDRNNEFSSSFYNFVHFSSAKERVNNFKHKAQLIENYTNTSASYAGYIALGTSSYTADIIQLQNSIQDIKGNFDKYENFLYYVSSSKAWPKTGSTLYSTTSSQALVWLGSDNPSSIYYGGEILESSQFDNQNPHNLIYTLPGYLLDDFESNKNYFKFVHLVGQMFDELWIYIKAVTDLHKNQNKISRGISKDLVADMLESLGFDVNNEELSEAQFYDFLLEGESPPIEQGKRLISSSLAVSKANLVEEKYKRIYHNLSYFYKTKGTLRGLKSLLSTYGIPSDMISIEEISTPSIDVGETKTIEEKFYYSVYNSASRIEIPWLPLNFTNDVPRSIEFMFNDRNNFNSGSYLFTIKDPSDTIVDFNVGLKIDKVNEITASLTYFQGNKSASLQIPVYHFKNDEGWWNVLVTNTNNTSSIFIKKKSGDHISHQYSASVEGNTTRWTDYFSSTAGNVFTSSLLYLGSNSGNNNFTGSFMEFRYWNTFLSEPVFDQHVLNPESIAGNNLYSSYNNLALRLPLGSDTTVYSLTSSAYPTGFNGINVI